MAWSFGSNNGPSQEQLAMFGQAAQDSGLAGMAMNQVDQMTSGMRNEDQVQMLYQLMALHPNEVALFFLEYPNFMSELASLIGLIVRKELYDWFSSGVMNATINAEKAAERGYSTITKENLDAQITKVVPAQEMQNKVHTADMQAMNMMNGHHQQQMMQQQMMGQPMMGQPMMGQPGMGQPAMQQQMYGQPPQRPGIGAALGGFGSSLIRGTLGLPPAQQGYNQQGYIQQQLPQQ